MKCSLAVAFVAGVCSLGIASADVTIHQVMELKLNMTVPGGLPAGLPFFNGPTEITARVKGTRAYSSFGKIAAIIDANRMILIDTEGKRYATTSMNDYAAQVSQAAKPPQDMPEAARQILQNIQIKVDTRDTGRSDTIQGIAAAETEVLFSMSIPVPIPGGNGLNMEGKFQIWKPKPGEIDRVPALREVAAYYEQSSQMGRDTAGMMTKMFGAMPGIGDKITDLVKALQSGGKTILRMHGEFSMPGLAAMMQQAKAAGAANVPDIPDGPLFEFTSGIQSLSTDPVPDSLFQIPEGYQEAPVADVVKAFIPAAGR